MPNVLEVAELIVERTASGNTPSWDPIGPQLGDPHQAVERVAICHEVNDEVLELLEQSPVDLLITYHPLLFRPSNRLLADGAVGSRAYRLIESRTALIVTHTDFDAAPGGMADALADFFNLREVGSFGQGAPDEILIGRVGEFEGTVATAQAMLADEFGPMGLRTSGDEKTVVEHLAVVPGSGGDFVSHAAEVADALVTGDVSHHQMVAARDLGLAVIDPGHSTTERPGMPALVSMVESLVEVPVVDLTEIDPKTWL